MQVTKQGKIKLDKRDTRVGNFVFTDEPEYIKIQDINRSFVLRLRKGASNNAFIIEDALKNKNTTALENYAIIHFMFNTSAKDVKCMEETIESVTACMNRLNEAMGDKPVSDEEDAKILQEQREFHKAVETLKEGNDNEEPVQS